MPIECNDRKQYLSLLLCDLILPTELHEDKAFTIV